MQRCFYRGDIVGDIVELSEEESYHLCVVTRTRIGETVAVLNGDGTTASGKLTAATKKHATIKIEKITKRNKPTRSFTLIQAVLKNMNSDYVVREATAIGVTAVIFCGTQNAECKLKDKVCCKLKRWEIIAVEACKQSGNPFLPKISYCENLREICTENFDAKFFGGLGENSKPLRLAVAQSRTAANICMAIGPEGDFSGEEYDYLRQNNFVECRICRNVLRSETAAICALSVLEHLAIDG
ncbi:MAG: 16S rRNA (uracil(1498)-N(3))-methyltransferase [Puniceicoccales bacterium]|jgi:16S rRNA (uracil1498-N3)-methyltransferase|nr:16S rRNA (uracil(1498)-N(3))-methyltransferase [Puniceicoccales bacterium]